VALERSGVSWWTKDAPEIASVPGAIALFFTGLLPLTSGKREMP